MEVIITKAIELNDKEVKEAIAHYVSSSSSFSAFVIGGVKFKIDVFASGVDQVAARANLVYPSKPFELE